MDAQGTFVIEDVKVFTGHEFIEKGHVVVRDGLIVHVGQGEFDPKVANDAIRISRPGDTLIPGLIDAHIHALGGNTDSLEQSLRFGVTTVCDMHNEHEHNTKLKNLAADPETKDKYADFKYAGLGAVVEGGWPIPAVRKGLEGVPHGEDILADIVSSWPRLKTPQDAEPFVRQQVEEHGASYIKMFHETGDTVGMDLPLPSMEVQKAVVEAAHRHGVVAVGHAFSHDGAVALLQAGVDGLTHIFFDEAPSTDFVDLMLSRKAHCNPTLCLCASQTAEREELQHQFAADPFATKMLLQKDTYQAMGLAQHHHPKASVAHAYRNARALYQAGVPLVVGTDAAGMSSGSPFGLGVHIEMHVLVHEVGMTPADVLAAATATTADRFRFHDRGKVEVGTRADLVLVRGDVVDALADPRPQCLPIEGVWRQGELAHVFEGEMKA